MSLIENVPIARRFRGYLPVVVDLETGGFDANRDALLEIAAVPIVWANGVFAPGATTTTHVMPFPGANIDPQSLEITGIDVDNPLRGALEEKEALELIFKPIRVALKQSGCKRAILVGHNAHFDLNFLNAAIKRTGNKRSPFHPFSVFDTVTLGGALFGQTVLAKLVMASGLKWDPNEAHSAVYDTERTAEFFCLVMNRINPIAQLGPANLDATEATEASESISEQLELDDARV
jgi:ribonuclease T